MNKSADHIKMKGEGEWFIVKYNYRVRKTLESWHTAKILDTDNNSKPLPRQYSILL